MDKNPLPRPLDQSKLPTIGTEPLIKTQDPFVYSEGSAVQVYSFLLTNYSQEIAPSYAKNLPPAPSPTYLSPSELYNRVKAETVLNGWEIVEDGSLKFTDPEVIKRQKGALLYLFKKAIKMIMFSNMVGLSLPARIFDSITMLECLAYGTRYNPYFLTKAASLSDQFERFKLLTAGSVAILHFSLKSGIPLNPRLGETFQAGLEDGTLIFLEQTSHHPPISSAYYEGPKGSYKMYGKIQLEGKMTLNTMSFFSLSELKCEFADGQIIESTGFPTMKIAGLNLGSRTLVFKDSMQLIDRKNNWKTTLCFDYGRSKGMFTSAKDMPKDQMEGLIYVPTKDAPDIYDKPKNRIIRLADVKDVKEKLAQVKGSWLKSVEIDDQKYWDIDEVKPAEFLYANNPLPSDSRFREDVIWLRRGNIKFAEDWKVAQEVRQRQDKALRTKH